MGVKKIFQTLEDRNNPDEVESQGPFDITIFVVSDSFTKSDVHLVFISGILSWT